MTTILGCIADDFTGATDLAGLIARSGVEVSLRIGVPEEPPSETLSVEVIALKCRTAPVAEAVADCRKALVWLRAAGAKRFLWKYCSTFDFDAGRQYWPGRRGVDGRYRGRPNDLLSGIPRKRAQHLYGQPVRWAAALGRKPDEGSPAELRCATPT